LFSCLCGVLYWRESHSKEVDVPAEKLPAAAA